MFGIQILYTNTEVMYTTLVFGNDLHPGKHTTTPSAKVFCEEHNMCSQEL